MLSGKYWPVHPKPQPGELFSSWLIRTSQGNSPNLHGFCHLVWPERQIWTRDIDRFFAPDLINKMSEKTATPKVGLEEMFLQNYENRLFTKMASNSLNHWIRYVGVRHRIRTRHGLLYCPLCLESDEIPFFRKVWRTNLSPACHVHATVLRDCCDSCGEPCMPHRGQMLECDSCDFDLRDAKAWFADPAAIALGHALIQRSEGVKVWGADIPDLEDDVEFFSTVRAVMLMLSVGRRANWLRLEISKIANKQPKIKPLDRAERLFEYMRVNELHEIFYMTSILLRGWPWMMVGLCSEAKVWKSWAFAGRNAHKLPTLAKIAENYLRGVTTKEDFN